MYAGGNRYCLAVLSDAAMAGWVSGRQTRQRVLVVRRGRIVTHMFNGLINIRMLLRGAMLLAPTFIAGIVTADQTWFLVGIVTVSVFIAAERSRLAPAGVLLHTLAIAVGVLVVTLALGRPGTFVMASILLAIICVALTAAGPSMRWTGT